MAKKLRSLPPRLKTLDTRTAKVPLKRADPHYQSRRHQEWRELVMRRAGGMCQHPGGCTHQARIADHIVEMKDGGEPFDPANGQALCDSHHRTKTNAARAARYARREEG